jgi:hypothetical protein
VLTWVQPTIRVKNYANRIFTLDVTDGQTGIVRRDRARPHNYGIHKGTKSVKTSDVGRACNISRVAVLGGNPAIETLSELRNRQVSLELERQVQLQQIVRIVGNRRRSRPLT